MQGGAYAANKSLQGGAYIDESLQGRAHTSKSLQRRAYTRESLIMTASLEDEPEGGMEDDSYNNFNHDRTEEEEGLVEGGGDEEGNTDDYWMIRQGNYLNKPSRSQRKVWSYDSSTLAQCIEQVTYDPLVLNL